MRLGLRQKLLLVLMPIFILPLLGLGYLFYVQQRDLLQESALEEINEVLEANKSDFDMAMHARLASIQLLSESHLVRRYLIVEDEDTRYYSFYRPILELFASYKRRFTEFSEIRLLDVNGQEDVRLARTGLPNKTEDESQQAWFKEALEKGREPLIKAIVNPDTGNLSIIAVTPVDRSIYTDTRTISNTEIGGYLVVTIELERLIHAVDSEHIGKTGHLLLFGLAGELLAPSESHLGGDDDHLEPSLVDLIYQQPLQAELSISLLDSGNERYFIAYHWLLDDLLLYAYWPEKEKLRVVEAVAKRVLWFTVVTLMVVGLLIYFVIDYLVIQPILKLKKVTKDIGQAGFDYMGPGAEQLIVSGGRQDEVGDLTRSIQEMSIKLEASRLEMQFNAFHDSLTGLNNRHSFVLSLKQALERAGVRNGSISVMYIDTDGFKEVNDTMGHSQGDMVLKVIAKRLSRGVRVAKLAKKLDIPDDDLQLSLYRIGGDEFAVVLEGRNPQKEVEVVVGELIEEMKEPFLVNQQPYHLGISIGVAVYPQDGEDVNTLLKRADIAMYKAKEDGGNRYQLYDSKMEETAVKRHEVEIELREALKLKQFCLFYQPQFDAKDGSLVGCEALIRWRHPDRGLVPPGLFIPHAEQNGLILKMGDWALEEACRQNREWQEAGLKPITVAVNFSTVQFHRTPDIVAMITGKLEKTGLPARYLDVEITETGMMQSGSIGLDTLHELEKAGVHISMDDFGTGYSSLASLRDMPIDKLKIDKSFVDGIDTGESGQAIIKAIIALAKQLQLEVVAEGVEEDSQLEFLSLHGCEYIQGYLLSRPLPADEMRVVLEKHTQSKQSNPE